MRFASISPLILALPLVLSGVTRDIDGNEHMLPASPDAAATIMFYVTNDCPISNKFLPEIGRICRDFSEDGVRCFMAYVDPTMTPEMIRSHQEEYSASLPAILDEQHELVKMAGATVTPESAVFDQNGDLVYLGRVDNFYAELGKPRRFATKHDLRDALTEVLAGKEVSEPRTKAVGCFIPSLELIRKAQTP